MGGTHLPMTTCAPDADALRAQEQAVRLCFFVAAFFVLPALALAVLSGSILLASDLLDYGRVIMTSLLGWRILRTVRTGRADGFDYGAGKLQTLGGMVGAVLYMATLLIMAGVSVRRLIHPVELARGFAMLGALFQVGGCMVDGWLWLHTRRIARQAFSPVLEMQWRASRADTLACLAVFTGLALTLMLHKFTWAVYLDPLCALAFIAYVSVSFLPGLADGLNELLDKTLQEDLQLRIDRRLAENFDGYAGFHGVRSRRSGGRIFIEIALSFPDEQRVGTARASVERLQRGIEADIPGSEVRVAWWPAEEHHQTPATPPP